MIILIALFDSQNHPFLLNSMVSYLVEMVANQFFVNPSHDSSQWVWDFSHDSIPTTISKKDSPIVIGCVISRKV